jgi:hypothetical protein
LKAFQKKLIFASFLFWISFPLYTVIAKVEKVVKQIFTELRKKTKKSSRIKGKKTYRSLKDLYVLE